MLGIEDEYCLGNSFLYPKFASRTQLVFHNTANAFLQKMMEREE